MRAEFANELIEEDVAHCGVTSILLHPLTISANGGWLP